MNRWERRLQVIANVLVCGTGVLYAVMRYFVQPADEWAVVNHPWQPHVQHAHVLVAPLLVFACGAIMRRHVIDNWNRGTPRRRSGPGMAIVFVPMVLSGYLLQTSVSEFWRQAWVVIHVASSTLWCVAFAVHLRGMFRRGRARIPREGRSIGATRRLGPT